MEQAIRPLSIRKLEGIGGKAKPIGEVNLKVPFKDWNIIIVINFLIIDVYVPSLLSIRDMLDNAFNIIFFEDKWITHGTKR